MKQLVTKNDRTPVYTWNRAGVNTAERVLNAPESGVFGGKANLEIPEALRCFGDFEHADIAALGAGYFIGPETSAFFDANANRRHHIQIPEGTKIETPFVLELCLSSADSILMDDVLIEARAGSEATVVLKYRSEPGSGAEHTGRLRLLVERGAVLRLVKVQNLAEDAMHTDAVEGLVRGNGRVEILLAELGARSAFSSCNLALEGAGSSAHLDVVYLGTGERALDMSYRIVQSGVKTDARIRARGILQDKSRKILRDTLDFVSGAAGSKGREEEGVLLLSPEAHNISLPLLLCAEDDVEGEHAASAGRLDEKLLFYFMTRGIGETEAKRLLARAALSVVLENAPDARVRDEILETVDASIGQEAGL
ncbi:MAG: FeS assembly protein SufD [Oscillospiraceae bacterium]|nr:FeS assembly protein SufD [Oscillospiraceae bacterium]